jgi:hypothetical protein
MLEEIQEANPTDLEGLGSGDQVVQHTGKEQSGDIQQEGKKGPSKRKAPLLDTEVRRSPRTKANSNGTKPNGCPVKRCTACSPSPPTLNSNSIKNLAVQFCGLEADKLGGVASKRKARNQAVERRKRAPRPSNEAEDNEGKDGNDQEGQEGSKGDQD